MNNSIEINGIAIEAKFSNGSVEMTFIKESKIVKVCHSTEVSRFVRPENLAKVVALIATVNASEEANAYWAAKKSEVDTYEAEYQKRTGNYEARTAEIKKVMAI